MSILTWTASWNDEGELNSKPDEADDQSGHQAPERALCRRQLYYSLNFLFSGNQSKGGAEHIIKISNSLMGPAEKILNGYEVDIHKDTVHFDNTSRKLQQKIHYILIVTQT